MSARPHQLRPITVEIPITWTPEQALAVFDLLDELREKIWIRYGGQIQELMAEQQQGQAVGDRDDRAIP
jgi:hypothetical protein